ncbi:MAG: PD-(D/E)XK motif protein [Ignavibacteriales bacterium]|nr:PD-(D/E)XK motif protein [Ignavibacteriales bacterium]
MKKPAYISWQNFCATIIVEGEQRTHKVSNSPRVDFFWDGQGRRVGLWLETASDTTLSPELLKLSFVDLDVVKVGTRNFLEIATTSKSLRRQFYHFAVAVTEKMLSGEVSALDAVTAELQCFAELLAERLVLGVERQIGLLGELLFLERLTASKGIQMLDCWVGPDAEPHDFRVDTREFEVKTTVAPKRVHIIHGAEQLVASKDCSLFLLSVILGPPGDSSSFSLAGKVRDVERLFTANAARKKRFFEKLEKAGLRKTDLAHYGRKYSFRRALAIIPVDNKFPALTRPVIQKAIGSLSQRIESMQYAVNLEGLEKEDGSPQFAAAVLS